MPSSPFLSAGVELTKIELELEEAPDNKEQQQQQDNRLPPILVGSMPTELDSSADGNSTYPHGFPGSPGVVVVRAEEALIVVFVLVLWIAAIALFFNRWGKIRMLEPYQPKFQQQHRPSCAVTETTSLPLRTSSKFNLHCLEHPLYPASESQRPRQNSVFVGSGVSLLGNDRKSPRRAKSAFDLQSLVLAEVPAEVQSDNDDEEIEGGRRGEGERSSEVRLDFPQFPPSRRSKPFNEYPKPSRSFQRERGASVCHFDRTDVLARPLQRERGMSICHFDRTDVLARPLQPRDRGSSVCHFDRTDVLARPTCYRGSRASIAGNLEKFEYLGKSLRRDSRTSVILNGSLDKSQIGDSSRDNFQRFAPGTWPCRPRDARTLERESRPGNERSPENNGDARNPPTSFTNDSCPSDRPSCSKTPDLVLGYEATRV